MLYGLYILLCHKNMILYFNVVFNCITIVNSLTDFFIIIQSIREMMGICLRLLVDPNSAFVFAVEYTDKNSNQNKSKGSVNAGLDVATFVY